MAVQTLTINGKATSALTEQTILEAAREAGFTIPTLCHLAGTSDVGACRLCLVELGSVGRLMPACVTRVEEGMNIRTETPRLHEYRRMIVELLLAERNHVCSVCVANNHCELQDLAIALGVRPRPVRVPESRLRRQPEPSTLRHRPQSLHPLHAMRQGVR